jgi:N-acetylglucosaminyl-diphospho-decaprenol L-rhamnosyltransferase
MWRQSVSVIVVSYRTGPVLRDALSTLLAQPEPAEVVVVDNGNDQASRDYLDGMAATQPKLKLIRTGRNLGFAAGCNLGADAATGDYIALVNPDLIVQPGTFSAVLDVLKRRPDAWLCGGRLSNMDGTEQRGGRREMATPWRVFAEALRLDRLFPRHPHFRRMHMHESPTPDDVVEVPTVSGAFMVLSRDHWRMLGGMDPAMFLHMEDADFCLRVLKSGGTVLYCGHIPIHHHRSTSDVPRLFIEWHKVNSGARYFRKNFSDSYPDWAISVIIFGLWCRWFILGIFNVHNDIRWLSRRLLQR